MILALDRPRTQSDIGDSIPAELANQPIGSC